MSNYQKISDLLTNGGTWTPTKDGFLMIMADFSDGENGAYYIHINGVVMAGISSSEHGHGLRKTAMTVIKAGYTYTATISNAYTLDARYVSIF